MALSKTAVFMAHANKGNDHEILNVSMVVMLCRIYDEVLILAPKDCCKNLKNVMEVYDPSTKNVKYKENNLYFKCGLPFWFVCGFQTLLSMLKYRKTDLYFSTLNFLFFPVFNIISSLLKIKMFTLCHNDMEHLVNRKNGKLNVHWHMINFIFKKMRFGCANKCLVLGESIKKNMIGVIKKDTLENNVIEICHPYFSLNESDVDDVQSDIKIGIVGTLKDKDRENLETLSCALACYDNIRLCLLSTSTFDISHLNNVVDLKKKNEHLERQEYDSLVCSMDYLYFPYPSESYRLSASGAVYEAIVKKKPFIAKQNDYFLWLSSKFGELGYFEDGNTIALVNKIKNRSNIAEIKMNMNGAKEYISPKNYYSIFKSLVCK